MKSSALIIICLPLIAATKFGEQASKQASKQACKGTKVAEKSGCDDLTFPLPEGKTCGDYWSMLSSSGDNVQCGTWSDAAQCFNNGPPCSLECPPPRNCFQILESDPSAADGYHDIYKEDGTSTKAYCDMQNGGWTLGIKILSSTPVGAYISEDASGSPENSNGNIFFKFSDKELNYITEGNMYFKFKCGDDTGGLYRQSGWTSSVDGGGWEMDRDFDGTSDCEANRAGYGWGEYQQPSLTAAGGCTNPFGCGSAPPSSTTGPHINWGRPDSATGCHSRGGGWYKEGAIWFMGSGCSSLPFEDGESPAISAK